MKTMARYLDSRPPAIARVSAAALACLRPPADGGSLWLLLVAAGLLAVVVLVAARSFPGGYPGAAGLSAVAGAEPVHFRGADHLL